MTKKWEVNHVGQKVVCPCCGHVIGIVGASSDAPAIPMTPPPCGDSMAVTDGEDNG